MSASTKTLPEGYAQSGEIDLKINKRLALILNIAGTILAFFSFFMFSRLVVLARPNLIGTTGAITPGVIVVLFGLTVSLLTIHELVHGLFFWAFTRSRPAFALHLFYACAGAPDWYFPARQYAASALAPLLIIDAVGVLLMMLVPLGWVLAPIYMIAMNTGGSMGDLFILYRVLKLSPTSLVNDTGDVITFYDHTSNTSHP